MVERTAIWIIKHDAVLQPAINQRHPTLCDAQTRIFSHASAHLCRCRLCRRCAAIISRSVCAKLCNNNNNNNHFNNSHDIKITREGGRISPLDPIQKHLCGSIQQSMRGTEIEKFRARSGNIFTIAILLFRWYFQVLLDFYVRFSVARCFSYYSVNLRIEQPQ